MVNRFHRNHLCLVEIHYRLLSRRYQRHHLRQILNHQMGKCFHLIYLHLSYLDLVRLVMHLGQQKLRLRLIRLL